MRTRLLPIGEEAEALRKVAVMMARAGINPDLPFAKPANTEAQRQRLYDQARQIREEAL